MVDKLTQTDVARMLGLSGEAIRKRGYPFEPCASGKKNAKYITLQSLFDAEIERTRHRSPARTLDGAGVPNYEDVRALKMQEEYYSLKIKNQILERQYCDVAIVDKIIQKALSPLASSLAELPIIVKREAPSLSHSELTRIVNSITELRNEFVESVQSLDVDDFIEVDGVDD